MRAEFQKNPDAYQGKTLKELQVIFDLKEGAVRQACRENGIHYAYADTYHSIDRDAAAFYKEAQENPRAFDGMFYDVVYQRYNVSAPVVWKAIRRYGLKLAKRQRAVRVERLDEYFATHTDYKEKGISAIAKECRCDSNFVHKYMRERNLETINIRFKSNPAMLRAQKMREAMAQNPSAFDGRLTGDIAKEYDVSHATVVKGRSLYGIKPSRPRSPYKSKSYARNELDRRYNELVVRAKVMSVGELQSYFNVSERTLRLYLREHNIKPTRKPRVAIKITEAQREQAEFFGELERDDEYFDVVIRNHGLGVSLTGEYWKRYRAILAIKMRDGEGVIWHGKVPNKGARRDRMPSRYEGGYIF